MRNHPITFVNFRDMGGLPCADGQVIRKGKLFRTSKIVAKTKSDMAYLESLQLDYVIDLRTKEEMLDIPDTIPSGCIYFHEPIYENDQFPLISATKETKKAIMQLKGEAANILRKNKCLAYAYMPYSKKSIGRLFSCMDEGKTIAFHCYEGKDRTGILAMMIEFAFGRSEDEILREYMSANVYHLERNKRQLFFLKLLRFDKDLIRNVEFCESTHEELFATAMESIHAKYSTVQEFLLMEYNVTSERIIRWKDFYLE